MKRLLSLLISFLLFVMMGCDGVNSVNTNDSTILSSGSTEIGFGKVDGHLLQFPGNGHYYMAFARNGITWDDARDAADAMGMYKGCRPHLATISSQEENDFIVNNFENAWLHGYWLGGYQPDGNPEFSLIDQGWAWITGEPFSFANWAPFEPNDAPYDEWALHFAGPYTDGANFGTWNDLLNTEDIRSDDGFVVEWSCKNHISSATGSGHRSSPEFRNFSFSAQGFIDGSAKGQWQFVNRNRDARMHGNVECLVVNGNEAWFAGTVTDSNNPDNVGGLRGFRVQDNGENGQGDFVSFARSIPHAAYPEVLTAHGWCAYMPDVSLMSIEVGNVQVH